MEKAYELMDLMYDTYEYPRTGFFPEYIADFCLNHVLDESIVEDVISLITNLNETNPYKHSGYQYNDAIINTILDTWYEISSMIGIDECYWEDGQITFNGATGKATFNYDVAIDSQWGNISPKTYKIYVGDKKIENVYIKDKKIAKIYKGENRIF